MQTNLREARATITRLNGVKYLDLQWRNCRRGCVFRLSQGGRGCQAAGGAQFIVDRGPGFVSEDLTAEARHVLLANTGMFRKLEDWQGAVEQSAWRGRRRFPHRNGDAGGKWSHQRGEQAVSASSRTVWPRSSPTARSVGSTARRSLVIRLVQEHIAAIEMHRAASDAMVQRAAEAKDASAAEPGNAELRTAADIRAAQRKLFASNAAWDAADRAVQVFGGRGWSTLYRPGRHLMDVRVCRIYEGTDEILKLKIAVESVHGVKNLRRSNKYKSEIRNAERI